MTNQEQIISKAICELPIYITNGFTIINNNIKINNIWIDKQSAELIVRLIRAKIGAIINNDHYVWVRYIDSNYGETPDRICIHAAHRAPSIDENQGCR